MPSFNALVTWAKSECGAKESKLIIVNWDVQILATFVVKKQ